MRITCGPVADMRKVSEIEQGLLAGLGPLSLTYNADERHILVVNRFIKNYKDKSMMGLCFSARDYDLEGQSPLKLSPERLLLAVAARIHVTLKWPVRFIPMSDLAEVLENGDQDDWIGQCLVVPDFHVSGPRGFGIQPWLESNLLDLLRERVESNSPTVIYAEAPQKISEQVGYFIQDHYLKMPGEI